MSTISNLLAPQQSTTAAMVLGIGRALRKGWVAYMNWRIEQLAIARLQSMGDRELKDIGLTRESIEFAVRTGSDHHSVISRTY